MPPYHTDSDAEVRRWLADALGDAAPEADRDAAWAAYEGARLAGLCHEGAWEAALGAASSGRPSEYPLVNPQSPL